jgi:hypothetical protein
MIIRQGAFLSIYSFQETNTPNDISYTNRRYTK